MLNLKTFLAVDFGAGSLKLSEFDTNAEGSLVLKSFVIKPLGLEGSQESTREKTILKALQETLAEKAIKSKSVNVCAPGFHVFSKFVKLPPVDANKVTQIIQYEAQQNVPFPLAEVVWDYQILGSAASGELEVLLVAVKSEIVEGLFRVAADAKLKLQLCDASPAALCNAFRYNYGDLEDCTMLLDIGAKTSNLLFFEKGKVFSRSIGLGANAITQDFANEAKLKFEVAEQIKIAEGFVSLGGAYEEPENPNQAAISKIARQFMTKLHIQVNQTMQFYRGQQGGSAPQRLFLSGGASIMPYTAQFFAEKLNIPVEYFNPFRNVQIDPTVNLEELAKVAHSLGEVVGLGLRNLANCPVEMNLMPDSTIRWRAFNEKKPYFLATLFLLALVTASIGFMFQKLADAKAREIDDLDPQVQQKMDAVNRFNAAKNQLDKALTDANQITLWMNERFYWGDFLNDLRGALIRAEDEVKKKYMTQKPDVQTGIWVEQMLMGMPLAAEPVAEGDAPPPTPEGGATPNANTITLVCRAVDLSVVDSAANNEIVYAVERQLKTTPLVDQKTVQPSAQLSPVQPVAADFGTFTFNVTLAPQTPLKLQ
ncbi:MAG TPA: type IV pilus assembly protein PilM [Candidatus Baltobacteraceae bacterium]|nr:type IV pilus assembly protein PilM [Candidatus Baltobacteraceae bacterium]